MLSVLQQGSLVHIIDKTNGTKYVVGEVLNRTEPTTDYTNPNFGSNVSSYFDLTVKVEGETYQLKHINSALNVVTNGNLIVSETKEGLIPTVENTLHNSQKIIEPDNIKFHENEVASCEEILKKLNPTFAREKERDERIDNLEQKMTGIDGKLDKLFNLLNK